MSKNAKPSGSFSCPSSFIAKCEYEDEDNHAPTFVTCTFVDDWFSNPLSSVRFRYAQLANYASGYAIFRTAKLRTGYDITHDKPEQEHIALIDLSNFLAFFGNPGEVAKTMESTAKELMKRWRAANSNKASLGSRQALRYNGEICRYTWMSSRDREECSIYEWELSTYHYTKNVDKRGEAAPKIAIGDIKLLIKLKTTYRGLKTKNIPDKSGRDKGGFRYDKIGYNSLLVHFLGLLRSNQFKTLLTNTKKEVLRQKQLNTSFKEPPTPSTSSSKRKKPSPSSAVPSKRNKQKENAVDAADADDVSFNVDTASEDEDEETRRDTNKTKKKSTPRKQVLFSEDEDEEDEEDEGRRVAAAEEEEEEDQEENAAEEDEEEVNEIIAEHYEQTDKKKPIAAKKSSSVAPPKGLRS